MALLRGFLVIVVCIAAAPASGHHMGRTVPIGFSDSGFPHVHLTAQVIASYFEEQMGRDTKLVLFRSISEGIDGIRDREYPMAVLAANAVLDLPEGVIRLEGEFGVPGGTAVLIIGRDAKEKLEFSLVQRYLDKLSEKLSTADWKSSMARVEAGEGIRGVALDMLREADLL